MPPCHSEVAAPIVSLEAALAVAPRRQRSPDENVNAGSRWAYLRVGVELLDYLLSPALYLSGLRVQAAVQINAAEVVFWREHEPYPVVAVLLCSLHGLGVAGPGLGVCAACLARL